MVHLGQKRRGAVQGECYPGIEPIHCAVLSNTKGLYLIMTTNQLDNLDVDISQMRPEFETQLANLVAIPTISSDPRRTADIQRGVEFAAELLANSGFTTRIVSTAGNPVVCGKLIINPSWPTVTFYNHLDVQPVDPSEWQTDPFNLTIKGDRYFGRGTVDDKGPALAILMAVQYVREQNVPLNFTCIWEFEEEVGSAHFEDFIKAEQATLATDSVLVADTVWQAAGRPAISYGLRGLVSFELTLQTGTSDVHSGLAGGVARNPLGELAHIITECYDATTGHVNIPGFYDDVQPVTTAELNGFTASGFSATDFAAVHGFISMRISKDAEVLSRIMTEPSFEVHGLVGGYTGPGVKNIIPPTATAKLSARLVPNQDPVRIFNLIKNFIKERHPDIQMRMVDMCNPYLGETQGPYATAATDATKYAFGIAPVFVREGGSIGSVLTMSKHLKVPIMLLGLGLPEHGYHSVNENFDWLQAAGGIKLFVKYFTEIAKIQRPE